MSQVNIQCSVLRDVVNYKENERLISKEGERDKKEKGRHGGR